VRRRRYWIRKNTTESSASNYQISDEGEESIESTEIVVRRKLHSRREGRK